MADFKDSVLKDIHFKEIASDEEYRAVYPVLKELRSTPAFDDVLYLCRKAEKNDGFKLIAGYCADQCIGVMGYRLLYDLTHGKHLYVDDLVVTSAVRSKKIGQKFIQYAEQKAKDLDCRALRLCTGIDNVGAQKFYEREGWSKKSFAFKKFLKP